MFFIHLFASVKLFVLSAFVFFEKVLDFLFFSLVCAKTGGGATFLFCPSVPVPLSSSFLLPVSVSFCRPPHPPPPPDQSQVCRSANEVRGGIRQRPSFLILRRKQQSQNVFSRSLRLSQSLFSHCCPWWILLFPIILGGREALFLYFFHCVLF